MHWNSLLMSHLSSIACHVLGGYVAFDEPLQQYRLSCIRWLCRLDGGTLDWHSADSIPKYGKGFFSQSQLSLHCLTVSEHLCMQSHALIRRRMLVHVRVQWIMEALKHPAYTVGWVAWICCSLLFLEKATWIAHVRNLKWDGAFVKEL